MSSIPENLKYTKDHEWVRHEDNGSITIGITDYAQNSLGDITFVELPEVDDRFESGDSFGVVESVKAASDLYMPAGGKIVAVNDALMNSPETVNADPYGEAWMIRIQPEDPDELSDLMNASAYGEIVD